ncbi:magnesium-translocating P-type ATPase [Mycolicibacterium peregrinum]|uniref:Magnesium-transporting ATPase, P-type 1 n=1 Tax=Mycolicibacterium peregrinum TaxID=43304 RepID=A0A4Z0HRE7_MYCPR|nr:magnesium-translocating P-type ATPase [Mycolicibacterium peregrinum]TGB42474.1 magnesium-translocating P-type ATPase [Mycolicibacterium peregrinum]TGB43557.1 magnesium-translocating P-type ATPase [Mycolicibacterium peregrinum]
MTAGQAASAPLGELMSNLRTQSGGLSSAEASARLSQHGPNIVRTRRVSAWAVLRRQLNNAVLILLAVTAVASVFLGDATQATIIGIILVISIGLGFFNEYRAERATEALHSRVQHTAVARRDGKAVKVAVTDLVPGDVIQLTLGEAVPADVRLLTVSGLECNEGILTGESMTAQKSADTVSADTALADATDLAFMGTIVSAGTGVGVVYATGADAEFGRIAVGLGQGAPETDFQAGLRRFSYLLLYVALTLTVFILLANLMLRRPIIDSVLFALAIAVGITPQLLPAVVSSSLASGSRELAKRKVLVKRLVSIEDLGDIDVLITDKTGTLTEGHISFIDAVDVTGAQSREVLRSGMLATDVDPTTGGVSGNEMDAALWQAEGVDSGALTAGVRQVAALPFDHMRRATTTLVDDPGRGERMLITKGAPEQVLTRCVDVPAVAHQTLDGLFAQGRRVVAVATKTASGLAVVTPSDESGLTLTGFLSFADNPKSAARDSLARLASLEIEVKVATGDNPQVAEKVCAEIGLVSKGTVTGIEIDKLGDNEFDRMVTETTIFARVTPEQKSRVIASARKHGRSVGFLGDGVNDALALHAADVGISVDSATDVAKDAADVVLLEKDLGVLADGVSEGRRIFANTIKYVLMGTSSNFGNMFSAAAASAVLPFLPMLPGQILLNNLLYDSSQLAIPTDRADPEQLHAPSHWNIAFIRRFMLTFGPISSLFDFLTFGLMLGVLHAAPPEFRTGWFVESLATQTLIIFVIRTRRTPFFRSRPSGPLVVSTLGAIAVGVALTLSPLASRLGFTPLPWQFFAALVLLTVGYLVMVELTKKVFYADPLHLAGPPVRTRGRHHRIERRASKFVHYPRAAAAR